MKCYKIIQTIEGYRIENFLVSCSELDIDKLKTDFKENSNGCIYFSEYLVTKGFAEYLKYTTVSSNL